MVKVAGSREASDRERNGARLTAACRARVRRFFARGTGRSDASMDELSGNCDKAMQSYAAAGDKYNETRTRNDSAAVFYVARRLDPGSEKSGATRQKSSAKLDEREGAAATHNNLGEVLMLQGHLVEARQMLSSAIPDYEAIEETGGVALILNDLAELVARRRKLAGSRSRFAQSPGDSRRSRRRQPARHSCTVRSEMCRWRAMIWPKRANRTRSR